MAQATETKTATAVADPAPLGLFGFATTTLVLSAANAGFTGVDAGGALGLALAFGGLGQLIAGMWEFKNGNTFGGVAFSSYGGFWVSFWILFNAAGSAPTGKYDVAWYLLGWAIVTGLLLLGTLRLNWGLVAVFALLFLTFLVLAIAWFTGDANAKVYAPATSTLNIGGYIGIATAIAAYYVGLAGILKATSGGKINLPLGPIGG